MRNTTKPTDCTTETTFATSTTLSAANALGHGSGAVDPGYVAAALPTVFRGIATVGATIGTTRKTIVFSKRRGRQGNRMSYAQRKVEKKVVKKKEVRVMVANQSSDSLPPLLLPDYF
jgi:hypothetical protein